MRIEGDQVVGLIRFSSRPEIDPVIEDVRSGVIRHLSVGYEVAEWRDDQVGAARTKTATRWTIREASFVSVPADRNARTRMDEPATMTRARQIRTLGRQAGVPVGIVDDLIDRGVTVEQARQSLLFDLVTRGRTEIMTSLPQQQQPRQSRKLRPRRGRKGFFVRMVPSFRPSPEARQFVGMTQADLARECLRRSGINVTGMTADGLITRALNTTSDYPAVLANLIGKSLRAAYELAPSGIRQLARETTAQDFRAKSRIMLDFVWLHAREGQRARRIQVRLARRREGKLSGRFLRQDFWHHAQGAC